jgi:hypothetical protein
MKIDHPTSLLIPAGLVAIGISVSVIALILISRKRRKTDNTTGKRGRKKENGMKIDEDS